MRLHYTNNVIQVSVRAKSFYVNLHESPTTEVMSLRQLSNQDKETHGFSRGLLTCRAVLLMIPAYKTQRIFVLCHPTHQMDSMCIRQLLVFLYLRTKLGVIHHHRYKYLFVRRFGSILRFFQPCK